ncbi:MAG TPA: glycoside hydrolase family 3 C-terminal domain-containing protein [Acidimicrobiales bacterium]|nr:glycoside hydrolase family 3 C-terminal domain-containing protein [Acidimicrobiales bacterium]
MLLRKRGRRWASLVAVVAAITAGIVVSSLREGQAGAGSSDEADPTPGRAACPWLNSNLPAATRVSELLKAMTPQQEASLLHLRQPDAVVPYEGYTPAIPSLCVPAITEQDGAAGVATRFPGVTQLPAPIADAAAFDPALAGRYGDVIGSEDATKGIDLALSPTINIDRSPLWGRSYETLGEDPYLTASLAVPLVRGIQGNRVVSVVKHFAVYNQETHRSTRADNSIVSERAMREIYLPAFAAVTQAGNAGAIMCSYNLINGTPACEDQSLLNGVLRNEWHFDGFVRSDCNSVYDQGPAIAAGVSQVKCSPLYNPVLLASAVERGVLPRATLDALARPLLTVLFRYNLIASPHPLNRALVATSSAHAAVARATADEGAVLLKNDSNLLPLNLTHLSSLALIGPAEGTPMPAGFGAMHVLPTHPVSALSALRATMGSRVHYDDGYDLRTAVALAKRSDVAVVVVYDTESERRDRPTLALTGDQNALVAAVAAANPKTIVVLETGSAVLMPWLPSVKAVLETWYPGEQAGTSLVDLLSGRANPSGKLPVSFPSSGAAMPDNTAATFGGTGGRTLYADDINVGYRWYGTHQVQPAFSFGYGLSYTRFRFSGLQAVPTGSGGVTVEATVTNVGRVRGTDVVQCYLGDPTSSQEAPRQLRGFIRVDLAPGKSKAVQLTLSPGDMARWNATSHSWVVDGGTYRLWVGDGSDSAHLPLTTTVQVRAASLGVNSGPAGTTASAPAGNTTTNPASAAPTATAPKTAPNPARTTATSKGTNKATSAASHSTGTSASS